MCVAANIKQERNLGKDIHHYFSVMMITQILGQNKNIRFKNLE